jgi:transposase
MYFAGIDAHLNYLVVAVVDKSGELLLEERVPSAEPNRLLEVLAPRRPLEVVVETCQFWPWIHDLLVGEGIGFHLAHAKRLKAIASSPQKSDAIDAKLLARLLAAGLIPEVYPKSAPQRESARLVRHRAVLVRQRTAAANRIHGQLQQQRLSLAREKLLRKETRAWLKAEAWPRLSREQRRLLQTHLRLIDTLSAMIRRLDRQIRRQGRAQPLVCLLESIPGIGPYRGLLLAAECSPISRFPRREHLVSYAGLAPITRSSGGHTRHGPIPKGANRWVRGALVSAIPSHLRAAPESELSRYYERLKQRLGWRTARVAAARKLARIVHTMLCSGEGWRAQAA